MGKSGLRLDWAVPNKQHYGWGVSLLRTGSTQEGSGRRIFYLNRQNKSKQGNHTPLQYHQEFVAGVEHTHSTLRASFSKHWVMM